MDDVLRAAVGLERFFGECGWRFAFIGGIANLAWGEIRTTRDVDVSLFTSFQGEKEIIERVLARYESRIANSVQFALNARVILAKDHSGIGVDIGLAGFPYEELVMDRRKHVDLGNDVILTVVTAEDLVVMKAFAGRAQDWADVEGVAKRQAAALDWSYVLEHSADMAAIKEDAEMLGRLEQIKFYWGK